MEKFELIEFYKTYIRAKKGKKTNSFYEFEINLEKNLLDLFEDVNNLNFEIQNSYAFVVEYPKIREIVAASISLRILQHVLISYLEDFYESKSYDFCFLDSNYACRKNFGTHLAVKVSKDYIKFFKYYLKLDIKSFFNSISKKILFKILEDDLKDVNIQKKTVFFYLEKIIFHNYSKNIVLKSKRRKFKLVPKHKSFIFKELNNLDKEIPIGNLTSQFFANIYLNKLDHFITLALEKRNLGEKYQRYMDDLIIYSNDKFFLLGFLTDIKKFLEKNLSLNLAEDKIILDKTSNGVDFLGYFIKPTHTLLRKRVLKEFKRKIFLNNYCIDKYGLKQNHLKKFEMTINSYFAQLSFADSYNIKQKIFSKYLEKNFTLTFKNDNFYVKKIKN